MEQATSCPRCGTAIAPGKSVCPRCEVSVTARRADVRRADVRRNAAGLALPSPVQGHATVMIAVLIAVGVLAALAFTSLQGVGPFSAQVVSLQPTDTGLEVELAVTNEGSRAGQAKCRVHATDGDGAIHTSQVLVTESIEPLATGHLTLPLADVSGDRPVEADCT
jgi:hypothetical protein